MAALSINFMPGGMILNALYVYCHRRVTPRSHSPLTTVLQQHLNPQIPIASHGFVLVMVTIVNALCRSVLADLMKRVRGTQGSFILKFS